MPALEREPPAGGPIVRGFSGRGFRLGEDEVYPDGLLLTLDGRATRALVAVDRATTWVHVDGRTWAVVEAPPARVRATEADADAQVRSPMPGAVVAVHTATGDAVAAGAPLLAVEAMKMEHVLRAPLAGTAEVHVRVGDQVVVDQVVATVHAEGAP